MPPNSKSNNSLLNLRRSTAGVLTPDLVTTKSVLLNSRAPLFKPKATCSWQKTVVQKRTPVLPPFETCCKQGSVSAQKVRTPRSVSSVPLRRHKSVPDERPPQKSNQKRFYTSPGASSLDNVVIKRVIKYCRNIEYLENVQYVQCLADFKGKRRLSTKLSEIVKFRDEQKKKEEVERKKFQAIAEKREQDLLKVVQRNEIYALNEAMKRLEESNFKEYVEKRNSSCHDNEKNGRNRLGAV
ncbi:hypothetical protein ACHWQZ_G014791 [Mnemiopsis leidyi]